MIFNSTTYLVKNQKYLFKLYIIFFDSIIELFYYYIILTLIKTKNTLKAQLKNTLVLKTAC